MIPITTNILRADYERGNFSYGNPAAPKTIVLIGSCRIVPILNYFRVFNHLNGNPFELLCFNPVEMWGGPGTDVGECASKLLSGYRFGKVDVLVCETLKLCGALNTVEGTGSESVFETLGMQPEVICRIPNWHFMHIYDVENTYYDEAYAAMGHEARVPVLRERGSLHKGKFLNRCRLSSFPELESWALDIWLTTRLGWTSEHASRALLWKCFELIASKIGICVTPELAAHEFCVADPYAATGAVLTPLDYEANDWKF
jgi:hypothetical protein